MAPSVEGAGVALNVVERGSGPAVLLVHGIASDAQALGPVAEALAPQARVIAYDRRGYGDSGAPEPYHGTTVEEQAEDAAALLRTLNRPHNDPATLLRMEGGFGGLFGDPDELQRRMAEFAEQMQGQQRLAWADNAIGLAVQMTVAAVNRVNIQGTTTEQAEQIRSVMAVVFPEAVTLVREARQGLQ